MPTEAQWEYATRAGTTTVWWTGDSVDIFKTRANVADASLKSEWPEAFTCDTSYSDGFVAHAPVNTFEPNPWGLHHVAGNVWEWVREYGTYSVDPQPGDGARPPQDPPQEVNHAGLRGGGWSNLPKSARSANRYVYPLQNKDNDLGVRPIFVKRSITP